MPLTIELPDELAERLRAVTEMTGATLKQFAVTSIAEALRRAEEGRREGQRLLHGPGHSLGEAEKRFRQKHGLPDLTHLSGEEIAELAEAELAKIPAEKLAEAERLGLI